MWASALTSGAPDWSRPVTISQASASLVAPVGAGGSLTVAADALGNGLAAWIEAGSLGNTVASARFRAASGWGTGAPISSSVPVGTQIQVAVDDWGRAIAVWSGPTGGIWAARFE